MNRKKGFWYPDLTLGGIKLPEFNEDYEYYDYSYGLAAYSIDDNEGNDLIAFKELHTGWYWGYIGEAGNAPVQWWPVGKRTPKTIRTFITKHRLGLL